MDVFVIKTGTKNLGGTEQEYAYKAIIESKRNDGRLERPSTGRVLWSLTSDEVQTFAKTGLPITDEKEKCIHQETHKQSALTQECED